MPPRATSAARAQAQRELEKRQADLKAARERMEAHLARIMARQFLDLRRLDKEADAETIMRYIQEHTKVEGREEIKKIANNVFSEQGLQVPVQLFVELLGRFLNLRVELSSQLFGNDSKEDGELAGVQPLTFRETFLFPRLACRAAVVLQVLEMSNEQAAKSQSQDPQKFADIFRKNLTENGMQGADVIGFFQALEDAVEVMITVQRQTARLTGIPLPTETLISRADHYEARLREAQKRVDALGKELDRELAESDGRPPHAGGAAAAAAAAAAAGAAPDSAAASAHVAPAAPVVVVVDPPPSSEPDPDEEAALRQRLTASEGGDK